MAELQEDKDADTNENENCNEDLGPHRHTLRLLLFTQRLVQYLCLEFIVHGDAVYY